MDESNIQKDISSDCLELSRSFADKQSKLFLNAVTPLSQNKARGMPLSSYFSSGLNNSARSKAYLDSSKLWSSGKSQVRLHLFSVSYYRFDYLNYLIQWFPFTLFLNEIKSYLSKLLISDVKLTRLLSQTILVFVLTHVSHRTWNIISSIANTVLMR